MSTMNAPLQTDRKEWSDIRTGRFTGSTNGDLMSEPRSKAAKEAGELSESAKTLIITKATEVIKGKPIKTAWSYDMKRGTALEPAMRYLLSQYWQSLERTSLQHDGLWMTTPDSLLRCGEPVDTKCPGEVVLAKFATEVPDGDFQALKDFDRGYAYQLVTQAAACGSTHANLVYCTDKIKAIPLSEKDQAILFGTGLHSEHEGLIAEGCEDVFAETGHPFEYNWHDQHDSPGFAFIARRFEIPKEEIEALERAIKRAYVERDKKVIELRAHLAPSAEQVEANVAELIEGSDVETEEAHDIRLLDSLLHHLQDMPWPTEMKRATTGHTVKMVEGHIQKAMDMIKGTIEKDLR